MSSSSITIMAGSPAFSTTVSLPLEEGALPSEGMVLMSRMDVNSRMRTVMAKPLDMSDVTVVGLGITLSLWIDEFVSTIIDRRNQDGTGRIRVLCGNQFDYTIILTGATLASVGYPTLQGTVTTRVDATGAEVTTIQPVLDSSPCELFMSFLPHGG